MLCFTVLFQAKEWSLGTDCSSGGVMAPLVAWTFKVHALITFWLPLCCMTTGSVVDIYIGTVQLCTFLPLSKLQQNGSVQNVLQTLVVMFIKWDDLWFFIKNYLKRWEMACWLVYFCSITYCCLREILDFPFLFRFVTSCMQRSGLTQGQQWIDSISVSVDELIFSAWSSFLAINEC